MFTAPAIAFLFKLLFANIKAQQIHAKPVPTPVVSPSPSATPQVTLVLPQPSIAPDPSPTQSPSPPARQQLEPEETAGGTPTSTDPILKKINAYRAGKGLSAVSENSETCNFASLRASEIAKEFNHTGFRNRINNNSLPYGGYSEVTENIAMTSNPDEVVDLWIKSPPHEENMRKDTPYVCVRNSGSYYAYEGWRP